MLDIDQIASLTRYGRGHLYNLNYEGKLPFKVSRGPRNKILVSIIEFAAYLDKTSLSEYAPPVDQPPELIVKKPGRPRGATTRASATVSSFQSELHAAIYRVQARELLSGIGHRIAGERLDGDESMGCEEQMRKTLSRLSAAVEAASYEFEQSSLSASLIWTSKAVSSCFKAFLGNLAGSGCPWLARYSKALDLRRNLCSF
ncbi:hypothetical protein [Curvibacter lanceolatus]|uniref:hypothetical protein n=1 Tax=Curvibacter lanceolatus TaxID=86182 RepID=UPI0012FCA3FB|nr:hypothetical protein [Curvibacter lanceolatus]